MNRSARLYLMVLAALTLVVTAATAGAIIAGDGSDGGGRPFVEVDDDERFDEDDDERFEDEDDGASGAELERLRDDCGDGDMEACDDLYFLAPGGSDDEDYGSTCGDTTEPTEGECAEREDDDEAFDEDAMELDRPSVTARRGPPPSELETTDIRVGSGPAAELGDRIVVHYVGATYADGEEFDSSWDGGEPVEFTLAEGALIEGWTEGIPGMRVGGRRELVIPADLAYGDDPEGGRPAGPLVFVVDLVAIVDRD